MDEIVSLVEGLASKLESLPLTGHLRELKKGWSNWRRKSHGWNNASVQTMP